MSNVKKIVLDQFGKAWGYADVAPGVKEIDVFSAAAIDGTPINVKTRKVSAAKLHEKTLRQLGGYETFIEYVYGGRTYYKY